jgi:hypothetical protein
MAEGTVISQVSENVYAVDQQYYIQFAPSGKLKPVIRNAGNKKELVVEISSSPATVVTYSPW